MLNYSFIIKKKQDLYKKILYLMITYSKFNVKL